MQVVQLADSIQPLHHHSPVPWSLCSVCSQLMPERGRGTGVGPFLPSAGLPFALGLPIDLSGTF